MTPKNDQTVLEVKDVKQWYTQKLTSKKNGKTVRATAGTDEYSVTLAPHQSCTFTEAQIQCLLPEAYRDAVVSITDVHIYRAMFSDGSSYENR